MGANKRGVPPMWKDVLLRLLNVKLCGFLLEIGEGAL